jgi:hypothetical protein
MKILICFLLLSQISYTQNTRNKDNNGTYHLFEAERGINNKPTNSKIFEFGEHNSVKLLAIAACAKCMPAVYTYQETESNKLDIPVYFNKMGIYILGYDKESFVAVLVTNKLGDGEWNNFSFSNFYSKNKLKIASINKEKISNYAKEISIKMMK